MWNPIQLALLREAAIAGNSLSAGLTALRKANYAHPGVYSHAFFSLSIGLERMLKILYIMDYLIEHGIFPSDKNLRAIGHDIEKLFAQAKQIKTKYGLSSGPSDITVNCIEMRIVQFMSRFAKSARYYNLNLVTGSISANNVADPITDWFENVGQPVLERHFTVRREARVRRNAQVIETLVGDIMSVAHTAEDGTPLRDTFSASYQAGMTEIIRKYGTLYAARLCRYLYYLLWEMRHKCHENKVEVPYLEELFFPFMNDDAYLLSRKTFPPRGQ